MTQANFNYESWKKKYIKKVGEAAAGNVDYYCRMLINAVDQGAETATLANFLNSKGVAYREGHRSFDAVAVLWDDLRTPQVSKKSKSKTVSKPEKEASVEEEVSEDFPEPEASGPVSY